MFIFWIKVYVAILRVYDVGKTKMARELNINCIDVGKIGIKYV